MTQLPLLGKTTLGAFEDAVQIAFRCWLADWSLSDDLSVQASLLPDGRAGDDAGTLWAGYASSVAHASRMGVAVPVHFWKGAVLGAQVVSTHDDDVANALRHEAPRAFLRLLATQLGWPADGLSFGVSPCEDPVVSVAIEMGRLQGVVRVTRGALAKLPAAKSLTGPALVPRADASTAAEAVVAVTLPLGRFPLCEIQGLKVGDVLSSQTPLNQRFEVSVGESGCVAHAALGKRDAHRAVLLMKR